MNEKVKAFWSGYGRTCFYNAQEVADRAKVTLEEAEEGIAELLEIGAIKPGGSWLGLPAYRHSHGHDFWKPEV